MLLVDSLKQMLQLGLPDAQILVSGDDGVHFEAVVISDAFIDKKSLQRQRMVYAIIGEHITSGTIHALSLKTFTQQEWQNKCVS